MYWCKFSCSLLNDDEKPSDLSFWRQFGSPQQQIFHSLPLHDMQSSQVLKFLKLSVRCLLQIAPREQVSFLSWAGGAKQSKRVRGHAPPEIVWNLRLSDRWKCTIESAILFLSCCLLRESMLLWSAWANISSYNSESPQGGGWIDLRIGGFGIYFRPDCGIRANF